MKVCNKCHVEKDEGDFHKDKNKATGTINTCKQCIAEYSKQFYLKNKERILKYQSEYRQNHPDVLKERKKQYHIKNSNKINTKSKIWRENNKDHLKIKVKERVQKERIEISPQYVTRALKASGFTKETIANNPQLIENYQIICLDKRFKKQVEEVSDFGICVGCKKITPKHEFRKQPKGKFWHICKACQKEKNKYYYNKYRKNKN